MSLFFFSSSRRHTRSLRDWSSDVALPILPLITVQPNGSGRGWYTNWTSGGQDWETFHLDQLIPFVDANLSTIPTRDGRSISGHSMGGFGAFHYAEDHPE